MLCLKKFPFLEGVVVTWETSQPLKNTCLELALLLVGHSLFHFHRCCCCSWRKTYMCVYIFRAHKENGWFCRRLIVWSWIGFSFPLWKQDTVLFASKDFSKLRESKGDVSRVACSLYLSDELPAFSWVRKCKVGNWTLTIFFLYHTFILQVKYFYY